MELFYGVLLMLGAILLSNVLNRFLPSFSIPVIQIILGIILSEFPSVYHFTLDPELFLILFLAPLLFHDGMHADKKSLWTLKKPIIMLGLGLVFFTVAVAGYLIHWMIPSVPLAAAFALAAALAPTDAVAVTSLGKRIKVPDFIRNILEGEALINDASGIVSFQFAVAAMVTGSFSLFHAGMEFVYVAVGGILLGILLTFLKYLVVKWVRSLGMENVTFHLLIEILTPLMIFMAAEKLYVSGILAVIISGVIHSFESRKLNPGLATLKIASKSVWSTLAFILNGLVFLILGMQIPDIITTIWNDLSFNDLQIIGYILAITAAMMLIRFLWSYFIIRTEKKDDMPDKESKTGRFKESLIISMSGVRGSVTLATILSLPFALDDGTLFPQRALIIFLAAGVILLSLLIANFLLPLILKNEELEETNEEEREACLAILESVMKQLTGLAAETNKFELGKVIRNYVLRADEIRNSGCAQNNQDESEIQLRNQILDWEEENTKTLLKNHAIDESVGSHYINALRTIKERNENGNRITKAELIRKIFRTLKRIKDFGQKREMLAEKRMQFVKLKELNNDYVLKQLYEKKKEEESLLIDKQIAEYEWLEIMLKERSPLTENSPFAQKDRDTEHKAVNVVSPDNESGGEEVVEMTDLVSIGFQMERDCIQAMFEQGRISRDTAKKLRNNIALMELQLKSEEF